MLLFVQRTVSVRLPRELAKRRLHQLVDSIRKKKQNKEYNEGIRLVRAIEDVAPVQKHHVDAAILGVSCFLKFTTLKTSVDASNLAPQGHQTLVNRLGESVLQKNNASRILEAMKVHFDCAALQSFCSVMAERQALWW